MKKDRIRQFIKLLDRSSMKWPVLFFTVFYLSIILATLAYMPWIALLMLVLMFLFILIGFNHFEGYMRYLEQQYSSVAPTLHLAQEDALYRAPIAVLIYNDKQEVAWVNPEFQHHYGSLQLLGQPLAKLHPGLGEIVKQEKPEKHWQTIEINQKYYRYLHQPSYQAIYFIDQTPEHEMVAQRAYDRIVFGYLLIDEYDELVQSMDDSETSLFDAKLLNGLREWANQFNLYLKRLEDDRFLILANQAALEVLEKDKFKTLESIKETEAKQSIPVSISVGLAYSEDTYYGLDELANQAQLNVELALARGGDQTVVRSHYGQARFYGGKLNVNQKRSITRSKLVYQALLTSVEQANRVIIAGHKYPDMDAIASALGIHKIVSQQGKFTRIILDRQELSDDVEQLLEFPAIKSEASNLFISLEEAIEIVDDRTLIIMVDHHRPSLSAAGPLVNEHEVVIIDHHRRSEDFPVKPVLTFIEPYASSTSELVTEFFIYMRNSHETLNKTEATALLAGIIVDTNNFASRTGSRTFDAASYLKSRGANEHLIQQLLKEDLKRLLERNEIIAQAHYIDEDIILAKAQEGKVYDNVIASQAADVMLTLKKVEASFVIFERPDQTIGISARSMGGLNVQTLMEEMGGGGHLTTAATQIKESSLDQVYQDLLETIQRNKEES